MLNYAIIGTSPLSRMYADAIESAGESFYAVSSRNLSRAEEFAGGKAKAYNNLDKLLADDAVDAVYICLPNKLHVEVSLKCLEAGKHVLCEKPITTTAQEYSSLCRKADVNRKKYAEAVMNFYSPAMPILKKEIVCDQIVSVRLDYSQRSSKLDKIRNGGMVSAFDRELSGGVLYDLGVYPLHFAVNLFGEPKKVTAMARWLGDVDVSDILVLTYDTFDAVITISKAGQGRVGSEIICDKATYTFQNVSVVFGAEKKCVNSEVSIKCGIKLPNQLIQDPSVLCGVQKRIIKAFTRWVQGKDEAGYLALREESLVVQRIMEEAHRQIGY